MRSARARTSTRAEAYQDIRGTGSITVCYAVILHEFNGHACRYRRRGSFILHAISRRDRDPPPGLAAEARPALPK